MAENKGAIKKLFSKFTRTPISLKTEGPTSTQEIAVNANVQPVKCDGYNLSDQCKASMYMCDLQKHTLPPADVWVTVFLDPELKVFHDEISRLLFASGGHVLRKQMDALLSISKTPLEVGKVLVTAPGGLPCNQAFHVIFKENVVSSWYKAKLKGSFTECINLAQTSRARSIAFSLFTCQQMFEYGSVIDAMVEAAMDCKGSINEVLFVSQRFSVVKYVSSTLHDYLSKKDKADLKKLVPIGSYTMKNGPHVQLLFGDILFATTDAMIISSGAMRLRGFGMLKHIYRNGGPVLQNELNNLSGREFNAGSAFAVSGDELLCNHVIVAIMPSYETQCEIRQQFLEKALLSSLECAEKFQTKTVSLPAIGSNWCGLQKNVHCTLLVKALVGYIRQNPSSCIQRVNFVEHSDRMYKALQSALKKHPDFSIATQDNGQNDVVAVKETGTPAEILARGPAALEAYLKASQDGTKPVYRTRLMLVGQERVGKTSLMKRLSGKRFDTGESITDGVDASTLCEVQGQGTKPWKIQENTKTDLATHVQSQYVDTLCALMAQILTELGEKIFDESQNAQGKQDDGLEKLTTNEDQVRDATNGNGEKESSHADEDKVVVESASAMMDSTQPKTEIQECDRDNHGTEPAVVPDAILEKLLQQLNKQESRQESSKDGGVLEFQIWDFAGQDVYYTTHQVFLSTRAIYILVFDLCLDLNKPVKVRILHGDQVQSRFHDFTGLGFINFWMQSIYAYATVNQQTCNEDRPQLSPPIFIVGTHRDSSDISPDPQERRRLIDEKFQIISDMIAGKPYEQHVVSKYYAIENSNNDLMDSQLSQLRQHIASVASQEPYMGEQIPVQWLTFEKSVAEAINRGQHYMTLNQVKDLTGDLGIGSDAELFTMLHFYHDLGTIIYFGGENKDNAYLQDMVILDPHWLIDIFKRIITVMPHQEQWATLKNKWRRLKEEAILEDHLINHMWHDLLPQKPALLALMEMFDLLCPRLDVNENMDAGTYYVPACLQPGSEENAQRESLVRGKPIIFYIDFLGFLPDGLFHRLLVQTARWSQQQSGEEPQLYYRCGNFSLDDEHNFQLVMQVTKPICIKVTVCKTPVLSIDGDEGDDSDAEAQPGPKACSMVQTFLAHALEELTFTWIHGIKYEFSVACPCNDFHQSPHHGGTSQGLHLLQLEECLKKTKIKCKEKMMLVQTGDFKKWFNDDLTEVDADKSKKKITTMSDVELLELAGIVGIDWKKLGVYLGLKVCHLDAINCDHPLTEDKAFNMLIQWHRSLSKMADARALLRKALEKCDLLSLAETLRGPSFKI